MANVVPMTAEHVVSLAGTPPPATIKGLTMMDGDRVLAVAGFYLSTACYEFASFISPELHDRMRNRRWIREALRAGKQVLELEKNRQLPIYAVADQTVPGSRNWLEHLGFYHHHKDIYKWHGSR